MGIITDLGARVARALPAAVLAALAASAAPAQEAYIQIEADRSLEEGRSAARRHEGLVPGVGGYAAAGGWYVVALGPFEAEEARARLARLRAERRVPADAFLTEGSLYRQRFWPPGGASEVAEAPGTAPEPAPAAAAPADAADETPAEARASERALDRAAREGLQVALRWAGVYDGAIDAAFGAGTRRAMADWQAARGFDPTGVLTTAQRAALLRERDAVFEGLGLARVEDAAAGVSVEMPTARLAFEARETPFARYAATDGGDAQLLLISQEGDERTLAGLFEVLQTLEVVPRAGPRSIEGDRFELEGRDARRATQGFARLADGRIKGMVLVWPAGDEERRERLWERMRASFEADRAAVLGPEHATPAPEQRLDRLAGMAIRQPALARSGFFVDGDGAVLTTAEVAGGACGVVLIDDAHAAEVAWSDGRVALLRPERRLAPPRVAALAGVPGRLGSPVAVAGFPFGGALGRASLTHGSLEELRGLGGDGDLDRYALAFEPGDAGGPVLAPDGTVAGMLLSGDGDGDGGAAGGRTLPAGVAFGVDAGRLRAVLDEAGVEAPSRRLTDLSEVSEVDLTRAAPGDGEVAPMTPERLAREAAELAVLVTCHE